MKRKLLIPLLAGVMLLVAVACGNGSGDSNATVGGSTLDTATVSTSFDTVCSEATTPKDDETSMATDGTTGRVAEAETARTTEEDTTYEPIDYDLTPIEGVKGETLRIRWNPYLYSPTIADEAIKNGMDKMVFALLNRRVTVQFDSSSVMHQVLDNLFYEFPPSALAEYEASDETLTVSIFYRLERERHLQALEEFGQAVENAVASQLLFGDGDAEKAILLYHFVATSVSYWQTDYESWQTNAYYALVGGKAICYGFADCYNYLLRQVGVEAHLVKSYRPSDRADHGWSLVKIDGQYYHCDPTWESSAYGGNGFVYFGYTDDKRDNSISLQDAKVGYGGLEAPLSLEATSKRFQILNGDKIRGNSWTLDREKKQIVVSAIQQYSYAAD